MFLIGEDGVDGTGAGTKNEIANHPGGRGAVRMFDLGFIFPLPPRGAALKERKFQFKFS
jgi:hypothetical protein